MYCSGKTSREMVHYPAAGKLDYHMMGETVLERLYILSLEVSTTLHSYSWHCFYKIEVLISDDIISNMHIYFYMLSVLFKADYRPRFG